MAATIVVRGVIYSVPSRLSGFRVKVHIYDDTVQCFYEGEQVATHQRKRKNKTRLHAINYRHVINALLCKPGAFRHYVYQVPTPVFKEAWEKIDQELIERDACREYLQILKEASVDDREEVVGRYLEECLANQRLPKAIEAQDLFKSQQHIPGCEVEEPNLDNYKDLLEFQGETTQGENNESTSNTTAAS